MKIFRLFSLLLLVCALHLNAAFGQAYMYVSPDGSDVAPGTLQAPFQTVQHAVDQMEPGDVCYLMPGHYGESVVITRSGTEDKPIKIMAYLEDTVTFDGTREIAGEWMPWENGIWKTQVDFVFNQLFVDGKMMIEARWPNVQFKDIIGRKGWATADDGSRYGHIVDADLAETGIDWKGARVYLNVAHQFFSWTRSIADYELGSPILNYPEDLGDMTRFEDQPGKWSDDYYYLAGKLEALDAPGEWFLDEETGTLYLMPLEGVNPSASKIEAKVRDLAISGKGVEFVTIQGIEFFATTFRFEDSENIIVEDSHLLFPTMSDGLGSGLSNTLMDGDHNVIQNCSLAYSNQGGFTIQGSQNLIENSLVHSVCWDGSLHHVGIRVADGSNKQAKGSIIRNCEVFNTGNTCVSVTDVRESIVEYSHIHEGGLACKDVSLLYTHLPTMEGSIFRYNWVHGVHAPFIALGIRGDDQTRNLIVHHNVVWDASWAGIVIKGDHNVVVNNTVFGAAENKSDIILRDQPEPEKPWRYQWPLLEVQNQNSMAYNNSAGSATSDMWQGRGLMCEQGNNYFGPSPMMVDPENLDFRPAEGSPLIDGGKVVEGITRDFIGAAPDIGAYEFGGDYWVPGIDWGEQARKRRLYSRLTW